MLYQTLCKHRPSLPLGVVYPHNAQQSSSGSIQPIISFHQKLYSSAPKSYRHIHGPSILSTFELPRHPRLVLSFNFKGTGKLYVYLPMRWRPTPEYFVGIKNESLFDQDSL